MENLAGKRVLITGASAGIGQALALELAEKGCELFLLARRGDRLMQTEGMIRQKNKTAKVHLIVMDVNDPELPKILETRTEKRLDVLINNAGLALGKDKVQDASWSDFEEMIQTNITAAFRVAHTVLPWMLAQKEGDILNVCSIAGHYTYVGGSVYAATKHAVLAFTRCMREETAGQNIRVMQISPGMVETEFSVVRFKGDEDKAKSVYKDFKALRPEDVSRMMIFMLEQPRHVVIDEIITMPTAQGSANTVVRKG